MNQLLDYLGLSHAKDLKFLLKEAE